MFTNMKSHLCFLIAGLLLLSLAACGPAPNPKLQKSAEAQHEEDKAPAKEVERPAPEQPRASVAPVAAVEQPKPQPAAKPKTQPAPRPVASRRAESPTPAASAEPAKPSRPADDTASSRDRSLSLPAPVAPPVSAPAPPSDQATIDPRPERVEPPAPPRHVIVPSGTTVAVRMIDSVDSETARAGETFKGSLDAPIVVDNETVFPRGSEVYVKLAKVQTAGRVSGRSEIQLQLDRIYLGRKSYLVESDTHVTTGASQAGRTARSAGVGAAIGAAIGAISGGGKGAVIGGATGAGAGAGVEAVRKGEQVRVESESLVEFRLDNSLDVTMQAPSSTPQRNNPSGPNRFGTRP